jgi:hypothetical protein
VVSLQPEIVTTYTTILTLTQTQSVTSPPTTITISEPNVCPMPTNTTPVLNPQATGTNSTWGCQPGYVCSPPKPDDCEFFRNPPDRDYVCDPQNCILAPLFTDVSWPAGKTDYYLPTEGYFNLNPEAFGLSFGIFEETIVTEQTSGYQSTYSTGDWTSQTDLTHFPPAQATSAAVKVKPRNLLKRDDSIVPALCFAPCNNCLIEGQKVGKVNNLLCSAGTPFQDELSACETCASNNGAKGSLKTYVQPQFQQFLDFCSLAAPQSALESPTSTQTSTSTPVGPLSTSTQVLSATTTAPTSTPPVVIVTSQASATPGSTMSPSTSTSVLPPSSSSPFSSSSSESITSTSTSSSTTELGPSLSTSSKPPEISTNASNSLEPSSFSLLASLLLLAFVSVV